MDRKTERTIHRRTSVSHLGMRNVDILVFPSSGCPDVTAIFLAMRVLSIFMWLFPAIVLLSPAFSSQRERNNLAKDTVKFWKTGGEEDIRLNSTNGRSLKQTARVAKMRV